MRHQRFGRSVIARPVRLLAAAALAALVAAGCARSDRPYFDNQAVGPDEVQGVAEEASGSPEPDADTGGDGTGSDAGSTDDPGSAPTDAAPAPAVPPIDTVPGMPPVVDPTNIYSEIGPNMLMPQVVDHVYRVYVPNEVSGTVTVIDPTTFTVIDTFQSGFIPQHVVPSWDLTTLYVLNNNGNTIVPIDARTGVPGQAIPVQNPYNLYWTPDGREAIVVAEGEMRFDFADPKTFEVHSSLQTDCYGLNHIDFSIDGRYIIATCEYDGRLIKVDMTTRQIVGDLQIDMSMSGKTDPVKGIAQPQDVRIAPDGSIFYIADLITDGVYLIDGDSFTQVGFIQTGIAAHGLYPSRDGTKLYVVNRGTNIIPAPQSYTGRSQGSIAVIDFATNQVVERWEMPVGSSPDMGNLTPDGTQLWLGGRYDSEVYVIDTRTGELLAEIPVGDNPHGLTVWPQPGRYSLGHTGNMR